MATAYAFPTHCSWCDSKKHPPASGRRQDILFCSECDLPHKNVKNEPKRRDEDRTYRGPCSA